MSAYPYASTRIDLTSAPEAQRLVTDGGQHFVSVSADATTHAHLYLEPGGGPHVSTKLAGRVYLYLSPDEAVTLASQLMRAVGRPRIEVVA